MAKRKAFKTLSTDETALVRGGGILVDEEHPWGSDVTDDVVGRYEEDPWDVDEDPWDAD